MKLPFESYNPIWKAEFEELKNKFSDLLKAINPQIDHVGSTSVKGLSAKPIIDIQLGVNDESELNAVPILLQLPNLVYYEKYNEDMPTRRFFVLFKRSCEEMNVLSS